MGSRIARARCDSPPAERSTQGEITTAQAGIGRPLSRAASRVATVSPPPALSPPMAIWLNAMPLSSRPLGGDAVVDRGGEGMLRRQAVIGREDRQTAVGAERPQHVAMRFRRADDIAAAMEIEHSGIVALHTLAAHPLAGNAAHLGRLRLEALDRR